MDFVFLVLKLKLSIFFSMKMEKASTPHKVKKAAVPEFQLSRTKQMEKGIIINLITDMIKIHINNLL